MKKLILLLISAVVCIAANARTFALCTAISSYERQDLNPLTQSTKDAKSLAAILKSQSKDVSLITGKNANEANVKAALKKIAATAGANDEVIFFFSGHGGPGAFCLFDKNMTYYDLLSILSKSKCRNILVIIDACNSGSLAGAVTQLKKENKWSGNIASIVSSRASENSIENPLVGAGFLAQGIMKGLRGKADADGNKQLTIRELFRYTFNDVSTRAAKVDKAQHPQLIAPAAMQDNVIWKW